MSIRYVHKPKRFLQLPEDAKRDSNDKKSEIKLFHFKFQDQY